MIACKDCRYYNHNGKPSVMRGSAYCSQNRIDMKILRLGFFEHLKEKIFGILHPENKQERKHGGFRW